MGILAAMQKNTVLDYVANVVALSGLSIPNFWLGIMLILLVSVQLGWLPASGYEPFFDNPVRSLETMIMPAFVLGNALAATLMRHTRSAMLSVLSADYIRTARAKGLPSSAVVLQHSFRNALLPIVTIGALLFGELLAGAVLTEQIFTIPGFGKLIVDAVFNRDYAVVQGVVLCTAVGLHLDEPAGRRTLCVAEPAHEDGAMTVADRVDLPIRRRAPLGQAAPGASLDANRAALVGFGFVGFFALLAVLAPLLPIADPNATDWTRGPQGAVCGCIGSAPTKSAATFSRA